MIDFSFLDRRPLLVAVAGPNGAGKSTFYETHLNSSGLAFVNADVLALQLDLDAYEAADHAAQLRQELVRRRESFIFETVFSDPAKAKLTFLKDAVDKGYTVALFFIGLADVAISDDRVAMRVAQGGHDVPKEKLEARYPRILANLASSIGELPHVLIYDNSDLEKPYRLVAYSEDGIVTNYVEPLPEWLKAIIE